MGPSTSLHMLVGAILGWGFLSPLAKSKGWATGSVGDWEEGSKGWIMWVSLAIMLADSLISLGWLVVRSIISYGPSIYSKLHNKFGSGNFWKSILGFSKNTGHAYHALDRGTSDSNARQSEDEDAPSSELISTRTVLIFLPLTLILNVICMQISFGKLINPLLSTLATFLALFLSIMGVRALGETDLNPVSGISKITQLIFALVTPASSHTRRSAIVTNLLAGAVSESGALQAGDMMQDLKTGHLLGASPKAQFYGQLIGSLVGAVISAAVYKLYVNVYEVPGSLFQVPTAYVWIFTARLVTGEGLPEMAWQASAIAAVVFAAITILRIVGASTGSSLKQGPKTPWHPWIPGGIAVAVGMYNVPSFTLARAIGGVIVLFWQWWQKRMAKNTQSTTRSGAIPSEDDNGDSSMRGGETQSSHQDTDSEDMASSTVIILASGLILGEGVVSIVNLGLASAKVPHL